jgi:hypothetical protein
LLVLLALWISHRVCKFGVAAASAAVLWRAGVGSPVGCRNSSAPNTNRRTGFDFAPFADDSILWPMNSSSQNSANPLIAKVQQLFSRDLALENDYMRQENKILRTKLGARVPLTEADRRILVQYGLRIKDRLAEVISIAKPDTLLAWNRRQKRKKWTFQNASAKTGRPRKADDAEALIVRWPKRIIVGVTSGSLGN